MYEYNAVCTRVIDGDTAEFDVDLGFNIHYTIRGRFLDVNAPEIFRGDSTEKSNGQIVKEHVESLILNKEVIIRTFKNKMSFNRWIVEIFDSSAQININEQINTYINERKSLHV